MALDHFVPQVHLRKFNSPALKGARMYAIRKASLGKFQPSSADVCRIEDGNTNAYLRDDRAIEEFLRKIEPKYTGSVERLAHGNPNHFAVHTVAGFVAYVTTCSPTAMRIQVPYLQRVLEVSAKLMDRRGDLPPPPESLKGTTFTELVESGRVKFSVDPKYPQSIGIGNITKSVAVYGNFCWEILLNNHSDQPFFTSDHPVAIEESGDYRYLHRLVPLTPTVALRLIPDINVRPERCDLLFKHFRCRVREINVYEAMVINQAIVRCAESLVFYRDDAPWVEPFVRANSGYRLEPVVHDVPSERGSYLVYSQRIVPIPPST